MKFGDDYRTKPTKVADRLFVSCGAFEPLIVRHGEITVVFLERSASAYWRANAGRNTSFITALRGEKELLLDRKMSPTDHLRIWRVRPRRRAAP